MDKLVYPFSKANDVIKCIINTEVIDPFTKEPYGYYIEADDFACITRNAADRKKIYALPHAARELFFMIPLCLNKDYHYVILPKEKRDEIIGVPCSIRTYKEAINCLVKHCMIDFKDKKEGSYWINHDYFFFGNRKKMFPDAYRVRKVLNVSLTKVPTSDEE